MTQSPWCSENTLTSLLILSSSSLYRKYNSLIQTQARELSHLRQRMREGQGVCHILTQNLGDTTKVQRTLLHEPSYPLNHVLSGSKQCVMWIFNILQAFEELLRANDIDYYMGQSFREQLAQNTALAQRVVTKISGRKEHLLYTLTFLMCFNASVVIFNISSYSSSTLVFPV